MKQYKLMQVALLAILLFGWAGCSQNEEEVPGNVRNGIVLNVTDTGIISNEPSTRTEDTGFVTTFTQGDQIGLFAVKDGAILDEINNMPFTFNGSSWSGKPILYDDRLVGVNFYAYYPYQSEMTGKTDLIGDDFFAPLAAGWDLTTEQSDQKAYAKQDLMTSNATALIGENGNYSLSFQLTHRMSLVVVKLPSTRYIFTDAEGVAMPEETPYVAMSVDVAFYLDNVEEGTKISPYYDAKKDEYRLLRKPSSENQIIGHYNDKQCTLDTAEKMKEGKYKRFVVDGGYKEVTHHLQVGDYYYADGSVVSGNEAEPAKDNCIGIVCWVGNPMPSVLYKDVAGTPYTATNDALLRSHPNCVHGLVMSLYTETGKFSPALTQSIHDWFMTTSFTSSYVSVTGYYDANENNKNKPLRFLGYNNSEVLDLYYDTFKTDFECFQYQDDCESSFPSPSITTGWYVPSSGELVALQDKDNSLESKLNTKLIKVSDKTMDISATYWSSTERNNKNMYIVTYSKTAGSAGTGGVKTNTYTYRFFLGF